MSTFTTTETFSITHARKMASKVAADLMRMHRLYGKPSVSWINDYETEIVALLKAGYLGEVTYGFKKGDNWIEPTLRYTAKELAFEHESDDPGRVQPGKDIRDATFYSYLTYSSDWNALSEGAKAAFKSSLPFQRTGADKPGANGYFLEDKTYSAGGRALGRATLKGY